MQNRNKIETLLISNSLLTWWYAFWAHIILDHTASELPGSYAVFHAKKKAPIRSHWLKMLILDPTVLRLLLDNSPIMITTRPEFSNALNPILPTITLKNIIKTFYDDSTSLFPIPENNSLCSQFLMHFKKQ